MIKRMHKNMLIRNKLTARIRPHVGRTTAIGTLVGSRRVLSTGQGIVNAPNFGIGHFETHTAMVVLLLVNV